MAVWEKVDVPVPVVPVLILKHACLDGMHFCLEYCFALPNTETKFASCAITVRPSSSTFDSFRAIWIPDSPLFLS
jgi:hypothetical protein